MCVCWIDVEHYAPWCLHYPGIDDIKSAKKLETVAVQFFNGFSHNTVSKGCQKPRTSLLVTSNQPFVESER